MDGLNFFGNNGDRGLTGREGLAVLGQKEVPKDELWGGDEEVGEAVDGSTERMGTSRKGNGVPGTLEGASAWEPLGGKTGPMDSGERRSRVCGC